MRIHETKVFKFEELSDSAKQKARDWYREGALDYDWWDYIYEDSERIAELIGLELNHKPVKLMSGKTRYDPAIFFSGFCCQGDGASFQGTLRPKKAIIRALRSHAPKDKELLRIAREIRDAQATVCNRLVATITTSGSYSHEYSMQFEFDYPDSSKALESAKFDARKTEAEKAIVEACRSFARWIYRTLEKEYEWLMSDEQVDESIESNEYEFTEEGSRCSCI